jgi:hypothetical protein
MSPEVEALYSGIGAFIAFVYYLTLIIVLFRICAHMKRCSESLKRLEVQGLAKPPSREATQEELQAWNVNLENIGNNFKSE